MKESACSIGFCRIDFVVLGEIICFVGLVFVRSESIYFCNVDFVGRDRVGCIKLCGVDSIGVVHRIYNVVCRISSCDSVVNRSIS